MNRKSGFTGAGLSTLLLVFVMLCLIVFSVLSLSTARADLEMSQKVADRTKAYYQAQGRASERLKAIDAVLARQYNETDKKASYLQGAQTALQQDLTVTEMENGQGLLCVYTEPINETQQLRVELQITEPEKEESYVQILSWEAEQIEDWNGDTGLPVLQKK